MCEFFSFVGDGRGNYLYSDWQTRKTDLSENWDSHTKILDYNKIPPKQHDKWSKYEFNPLTKNFIVDEEGLINDHESAEAWVNKLNFKSIIEPLIFKKIKNPLTGKPKKVTEKEIELLKQWDSIGSSLGDSLWSSIRSSLGDSLGDSVWDSLWSSLGDSVWDSIRAYISSFFKIKYKYDFSACIKLWNKGFVPSFDGNVWRLHSGKKAEIVYEWLKI